MEKIIITPEYCEQYRVFAQPPAMTVSKNTIIFNKAAIKVLALKKGDHFTFDVDNYKLRLHLSAKGFEIRSVLKNTVAAPAAGFFEWLHNWQTQTLGQVKTFRFNLGEFTTGAYPVELKEVVKRPPKATAK